MSRWFYTDPLAAAWMAKHYGMILGCVQAGILRHVDEEEILPRRGPFIIHPDSLHLLEPQVGDRLAGGYLVVDNYPSPKVYQRRLYLASSDIAKGRYGIIQRNGVPFHWPEQEP